LIAVCVKAPSDWKSLDRVACTSRMMVMIDPLAGEELKTTVPPLPEPMPVSV
jgi:hypothetical protein